MGMLFSSIFSKLYAKKPMRILMIGLDAAGKTTILYQLKLAEVVHSIPTIGFNVENIEYKNITFTVWDVGGQSVVRKLWRHYYQGTNGLIFVVDSSDRRRLDEAVEELNYAVSNEDLRTVPILVIANKQDLPDAAGSAEIVDKFRLRDYRSQRWHVQATCASQGTGLYEGLDWLANELNKL